MADEQKFVWTMYFDHWTGTKMGAYWSEAEAWGGVAQVVAEQYDRPELFGAEVVADIRGALNAGRWQEACDAYFEAARQVSFLKILLVEVPLGG